MKKVFALIALAIFAFAVTASAQTAPKRPRITGIDHVSFYTTQSVGVKKLYADILGLTSAEPVESGGLVRYLVGNQWVGYSNAPDANAPARLDHVAFATDNIGELRKYLIANGVKVPAIEGHSDHSLAFTVLDPEGNRIEFVERCPKGTEGCTVVPPCVDRCPEISRHMIHTGFVVRNAEAENHFYRELLGFRPYWHGGMKPDETDWVSQQVPDGTDWLEYMLRQPEHPDLRTNGVMDHISLGVVSMKEAQAKLESHGWKPNDREKAQLGKDGKWQLNLYDPDQTRIELMEFKPVEKPCCSDFTAPHPSE